MVVILLVRKWLSGATWTLICLKNGIYHNLTLFATKVDIKEKCSDGAVCYRPTPLTHTTSFEDKSFILMVGQQNPRVSNRHDFERGLQPHQYQTLDVHEECTQVHDYKSTYWGLVSHRLKEVK